MIKKLTLISAIACMLLLSACVAKIDGEKTVVPKDESIAKSSNTESIASISTSDDSAESIASANSDVSSQAESSVDTSDSDSFKVITETAAYEFRPETKTGKYYTTFHSAKKGQNSISITLQDGREMKLNYTEISFDENEQIHYTKINDLDFEISEHHDDGNNLVQVFECIEPMENISNFEGRVDYTITVTYKPEMESGEINMSFLYESDGEIYQIRYPDGRELTKTVKYNEDTKEYYFAE